MIAEFVYGIIHNKIICALVGTFIDNIYIKNARYFDKNYSLYIYVFPRLP
jgi:hypothetical protein